METKTPPAPSIESTLKEITRILHQHIPALSVYCFGFRCRDTTQHSVLTDCYAKGNKHDHFMLFACAEQLPQNATPNLMDIVATETEGKYTCTLLLHTHKQLAMAKPDQKHFYRDIIDKAWLVGGEALDAEKLKLVNLPKKDRGGMQQFV